MRRQFLHLMTDNNNPIIDPPTDPMEAAFEQARRAKARGEVPIGAALGKSWRPMGTGLKSYATPQLMQKCWRSAKLP